MSHHFSSDFNKKIIFKKTWIKPWIFSCVGGELSAVSATQNLGRVSSAKIHYPYTFYHTRSPPRVNPRECVLSRNHHLHQRKKTPEGVISLVEVVGIEPTSYSAAKKLSTYLVYLLFLKFPTRVNTLWKPQKAEYSYLNTFRSRQECSVLMTPRPQPTDKSGATIR